MKHRNSPAHAEEMRRRRQERSLRQSRYTFATELVRSAELRRIRSEKRNFLGEVRR